MQRWQIVGTGPIGQAGGGGGTLHNSGQSQCLLATALILSAFKTLQPLAHARQIERKSCSKRFERLSKQSRCVSVRYRALRWATPLTDHVTSRLHSTTCGWLTHSGTSKKPLRLHGIVACDVNQQTDLFRQSSSISLRHSLQPYFSKFQQNVKRLHLWNTSRGTSM